MPAQPQYISVPLTGISQKADPAIAPLDGVYALENYQLEREGAARKRFGLTSLVQSNAARLHDLGGGLLGAEMNGSYAVVAPTGALVDPVGNLSQRLLTPSLAHDTLVTEPVIASQQSPTIQCAITANYIVTMAFSDALVNYVSVYDRTGACVLAKASLPSFGASNINYIVVSGDDGTDRFHIVQQHGTNIFIYGYDITSGPDVGLSLVFQVLVNAGTKFDACRGPQGTIALVFAQAAGGCVVRLHSTTTGVNVASQVIGPVNADLVSINHSLSRSRLVVTMSLGTALHSQLYSTGGIALTALGGTHVFTAASTVYRHAACVFNESATGSQQSHVVAYNVGVDPGVPAPTMTVPGVRFYYMTANALRGPNETTHLGSSLAAKPWSPAPGQTAFPITLLQYSSPGGAFSSLNAGPLLPGYGVAVIEPLTVEIGGTLDLSGSRAFLRSWHTPGRGLQMGSFLAPSANLANYTTVGRDVYTCFTAYDRRDAGGTQTIRSTVVKQPTDDISDAPRPTNSAFRYGNSTLCGRGAYSAFHGVHVHPGAFYQAPDILAMRQVAGTATWGGTQLNVRLRFVWYDTNGNEMVSAWTLPSSIAVANATVGMVEVYVRNVQCFGPTAVAIECAASLGTSTTFFRVNMGAIGNQAQKQMGGGLTTLVQIGDPGAVGSITTQTVDTFTLPNVMPPPPRYLCKGSERAYLISSEDNRVYYTKPNLLGVLPEWAFELSLETTGNVGRPVAVEELGDKVVILGAEGAAYFLGDGPDALGQGARYSKPYETLRGLGCTEPNSVVKTPSGLFYRAEHTLVMVGDGLNPTLIGRQVADVLAAFPVTFRASYYSAANLVVWLLGDGGLGRCVLVYNITTQSFTNWTVADDEIGLQDLIATDRLYFSESNSGIISYYNDTGSGSGVDLGSFFQPGRLITPNIVLEGVNNYERCRYVLLKVKPAAVGDTLTLTFRRNGQSAVSHTRTYTFTAPGLETIEYHVPAHLQRANSFTLELRDASGGPGAAGTAGVDILGIKLDVAYLSGRQRRPAGKRF